MDLFDSIMLQTSDRRSNGVILSEEHDARRIDLGGGAAASLQQRIDSIRNGGYWDASEYGITAEQQIARLEATRGDAAALEREDSILRERAIRRAGLDTSNGRVNVMVAGAPPWHRLGVNVASAVSSADASRLAGLNWTVSKRPLQYQHDGRTIEQSDAYGIVRDDTGLCLGVVGSRYAPIQNDEGFAFLDSVLADFGAKFTSAGAIHGGKKVWMLADMPGSSFAVANGDEVKTYCIFSNPHDGSGQAWCYPTTERVVCANTLRVSTRDRSKGIGIRHTGSVRGKITAASDALAASVAGFAEFRDNAAALARTRVRTVNSYFNGVLDSVLPLSAADAAKGAAGVARSRAKADVSPEDFALQVRSAEKEIRSRGEILADILERFESKRCRVNGINGTAWAALQAVTEHADYSTDRRKIGTSEAQQSRRFESVLGGDRDEIKQIAYVQALALVG